MRICRFIWAACLVLLAGCDRIGDRVDERLSAVEQELNALPSIHLNTLIPTHGYCSKRQNEATPSVWVELELDRAHPLDSIVLVPAFYLNANNEFESNGFPVRYKIEVYASDGEATTVIDHTQEDIPPTSFAPLVIPCAAPDPVKRVRITATKLGLETTWRSQGHYIFALQEVLLFSGKQNVALHSKVTSNSTYAFPLMFKPAYLVDGFTGFAPVRRDVPLYPNEEFQVYDSEPVKLHFDLGANQTIDELRFYPSNRSPQFSHIHATGVGFPRRIEAFLSDSPNPDPEDLIFKTESAGDIYLGPEPLIRKIEPASGQYITIYLYDSRKDLRLNRSVIALSEIELLENGMHVLQGKPMRVLPGNESSDLQQPQFEDTVLTDGMASDGRIIPIKEWMEQLSHAAQLQDERTQLLLRKSELFNRQKEIIQFTLFSLIILVLLCVLILMLSFFLQQRSVQRVRDQIADGLHDEVGANLGSIALTSDMLLRLGPSRAEDGLELIHEIKRTARDTSQDLRLLTRFLEHRSEGDLFAQFNRVAQQMLPDLKHTLHFEEVERFNALAPIQKWELILFFKESLHNVVKHARASEVEVRTFADQKWLRIEILDDGVGMPTPATAPAHLIKRATKLKGELLVESSQTGGTRLLLSLKRKNL